MSYHKCCIHKLVTLHFSNINRSTKSMSRGEQTSKFSVVSRRSCSTFAIKESALVIPSEAWWMEGALTPYSSVFFWLPLHVIKSGLPQIDSSGDSVPSLPRREMLWSLFLADVVSILRDVEGLYFGVGSPRFSINTLPPGSVCNFLYIWDPILGVILAPRGSWWEAGPNDDRQEHELRFTAHQTLSSPVLSLPRGGHKSKQRLNSRSAKKKKKKHSCITFLLPTLYHTIASCLRSSPSTLDSLYYFSLDYFLGWGTVQFLPLVLYLAHALLHFLSSLV